MGGEHADEKRSLAHGHPAKPVDEGDGGARMRGVQRGENAGELDAGHGFVGLVVQAGERAVVFRFADDAGKFHARADFTRRRREEREDDGCVGESDVRLHG